MSSPEHHATESSLDGPQRVMLAGLRTRMFGRESTERIGRYRLLHALGTGAHGEVFEAVDEALQRRVAVKVLRGSKRRHTDAVLARRLRREAQALARLHHPNVVEVFGAGVHGGQVYIAMELVSGSTLRGWALDHPVGDRATAKATLGILRQAGRGLAAAHEAGVLHRDFKPGNVLVGDDGRVRVADFGLARWAAGDVAESQPAHPTVPTDGSLTATGGLLGTPRYMSPEQLAGGVVDERSDQYNFAVAAWELLTGELPGPRASLASRSEVEPAPALPKHRWLPRSVYRALIRALQPAPRDRHATMGALLDGLRSTSAPGPVLGMGAVGVLAVGAAWSTAGDDGRPRCDRGVAADEVAQVWSATRRREVEAGLRSTGAPFAATTVATVAATVDAYAEAWVEQRVALCRGTWHEGTVSPRQLDAGMGCLRQGLRTVDSLLARLDSADAALIERAQEAVVGIAPPSHCTAPDATGGGPPASPALRRELADAEAAALAGDDESAEALAERVAARALEQGQTRAYGDALEVSGALGARRREARGYEQLQRAY
ncbi:MAG: serine/threonine-protein kinase, partial [Myxococcota bacterium]